MVSSSLFRNADGMQTFLLALEYIRHEPPASNSTRGGEKFFKSYAALLIIRCQCLALRLTLTRALPVLTDDIRLRAARGSGITATIPVQFHLRARAARLLAKPVYLCARAAQNSDGRLAHEQCSVPPGRAQREPQGYAGLTITGLSGSFL